MNKIRISVLALAVCLLSAIALGGTSSPAEGSYTQIRINPTVFASYLGDNTNLLEIRIADNDSNIYIFTATGQTQLSIPENNTIVAIGGYVTIDDNYASSESEAEDRTRITITLSDADSVQQYDNELTGGEFPSTTDDNGTYYTVFQRELGLSILLTAGTWDLTANYEILAPI